MDSKDVALPEWKLINKKRDLHRSQSNLVFPINRSDDFMKWSDNQGSSVYPATTKVPISRSCKNSVSVGPISLRKQPHGSPKKPKGKPKKIHDLQTLQRALKNKRSLKFAPGFFVIELRNFDVGVEEAELISNGLQNNKTIESINLGKNQLGNEGAILIANALKDNYKVTYLNLQDNGIREEGGILVSEIIKDNTTLNCLILSGNPIGFESAVKLGSGLTMNCTLTVLHLARCNIGNQGADMLGAGLSHNDNITELILAWNNISVTTELASALIKNQSLVFLDMFRNKIGNEGAKQFSAALLKNNTITELNLGWNRITDTGLTSISEALKSNASLKKLNLSKNIFSDTSAKELQVALKNNHSLFSIDLLMTQLSTQRISQILSIIDSNNVSIQQEEEPQNVNQNIFHIPSGFPPYPLMLQEDMENNVTYENKKKHQHEWEQAVMAYIIKEEAEDLSGISKVVSHINNLLIPATKEQLGNLFSNLDLFLTVTPTPDYVGIADCLLTNLKIDNLEGFLSVTQKDLDSVAELKHEASEIFQLIKFCKEFDIYVLIPQMDTKSKEGEDKKFQALFYYNMKKQLKKAQLIVQGGICLGCCSAKELGQFREQAKQRERELQEF